MELKLCENGEGINLPELSPYYFGYLAYYLTSICGMRVSLLVVNYFEQSGIVAYK